MANRHKHHEKHHKARGGKVEDTPEKEREEMGEAHGKKRGGEVAVTGKKRGGRLDKRARGGGVGADRHPFSSAHTGK